MFFNEAELKRSSRLYYNLTTWHYTDALHIFTFIQVAWDNCLPCIPLPGDCCTAEPSHCPNE